MQDGQMGNDSANHHGRKQQCRPTAALRNEKTYSADNLKSAGKVSEPLSKTDLMELLHQCRFAQ
jgi:hypothetical protein